ncbi:MAG: PEP-utilizing enzyme, partial [Candidatus Woesearchaeota archaeon]|nr:PEP-utilizing enzyme [Candidatus Woesearchaeota archaeon]
RNLIWTACYKHWKEYDLPTTKLGIISRNNTIDYIHIPENWRKTGEIFFKKVKKDISFFENIIDENISYGQEMNDYTEKIFNSDLKAQSNKDLLSSYKKFLKMQSREYAIGILLPLVDLGGLLFVESHLRTYLKKHTPKDFDKNFDIFTFPSHPSFQEEQELSLLTIYKKIKVNLKNKSNQEILSMIKEHKEIYKLFQAHCKKYAWVYYVYQGPAYEEINFTEFLQDYANKELDPENEIKNIVNKRKSIEKSKEALLKQLKPDELTKKLLLLAGKLVYTKPGRKDLQSKSYYHIEKLQRELGNRLNLSLEEIRATPIEDLEAYLDGNPVEKEKIKDRIKLHVCITDNNEKTIVLTGKEAEEFIDTHYQQEKEKQVTHSAILKGSCACQGYAKGPAKIVNKPDDMAKMNYGDILISAATTPAIVPAMKKAAAFVTNEGGLTCHAAIVSREMNKPCVVGVSTATELIKDDDEVEVNATQGIVRILK